MDPRTLCILNLSIQCMDFPGLRPLRALALPPPRHCPRRNQYGPESNVLNTCAFQMRCSSHLSPEASVEDRLLKTCLLVLPRRRPMFDCDPNPKRRSRKLSLAKVPEHRCSPLFSLLNLHVHDAQRASSGALSRLAGAASLWSGGLAMICKLSLNRRIVCDIEDRLHLSVLDNFGDSTNCDDFIRRIAFRVSG